MNFDQMATTMIDADIAQHMAEIMHQPCYGANPSSHHPLGRQALELLDESKQVILKTLKAPVVSDFIFTSGATESINLACFGMAHAYQKHAKHIISTTIEHSATLEVLEQLTHQGFDVTLLSPDHQGIIHEQALVEAIKPETFLFSIHHVNNEIGSIQPIDSLIRVCRNHGILTHIDAAQSLGKCPLNLTETTPDFMSFSGHKAHGPKGVGGLYCRNKPKRKLIPLLYGGHSPQKYRPGTPCIALAQGLMKTFVSATTQLNTRTQYINNLQTKILNDLGSVIKLNGPLKQRIVQNLNFTLPTSIPLELIERLKQDFNCSSFSACNQSGRSHVLDALGLSMSQQQRTLRLGLSYHHTPNDCQTLCHAILALAKI